MKKWAFLCLFLSGCMTANYIATGKSPAVVRAPGDVEVFFAADKVPWKFREVGRVYMDLSSRASGDQREQIQAIREEAASHGADGVILSSSVAETGPLLRRRAIDKFEGIAIVKE